MSSAPALAGVESGESGGGGLVPAVAWRNLWRNPRRTWLTAGGIAFACLLLLFSRSMQLGSYRAQTEATTALLSGHLQVQHHAYLDDPRLEYLVPDADGIAQSLRAVTGVAAVTRRSTAFALLSVGERSFGAQVVGVEPEREQAMSSLPPTVVKGRYLVAGQEAVIGALLAVNLGAEVGDELVILGTGPEGGVAALAVTIVGLFDTGQAILDRSLVQLPIQTFNEGFYLADAASYLVINFADIDDVAATLPAIASGLPEGVVARPWQELLPDVVQGIALDRLSARLMYAIICAIVLFSIVNTFIMTLYERTRELGMLLAIGMKPWRVMAMLQLEALWLAILGGILGALVSVPVLVWLIIYGIPIEGMQEMTQGLVLPTHIRGAVLVQEFLIVPLVFIIGCQIAALIPGRRVLRINPVDALREE